MRTTGWDEAEGARARAVEAVAPRAVRETLDELHLAQSGHAFWDNRLFQACRDGALTLDDLRLLFSQYFLYSQNFTRYLAGLMANCEDDFFRARISENLWEEGGGTEPEKRHAEIFRAFLRDGLGVDLGGIEYADFTRHFVSEYIAFCLHPEPVATCAFLSLGTEGIVKRMYEIFVKALVDAGVREEHLLFFRIHIDCDDDHALTLEEMLVSYSTTPGWRDSCLRAMNRALDLRARFFENLYDAIQLRRIRSLVGRIQDRRSLAPTAGAGDALRGRCDAGGVALYRNAHEKLGIDFQVKRLPFGGEVLDPRVVRIAPRKANEMHRHAHESVFVVADGTGHVLVDGMEIAVGPGDIVFVPRWAYHQTRNAGEKEMVLLAITDYGLTGRAFIGHYDRTARMGQADGSAPGP